MPNSSPPPATESGAPAPMPPSERPLKMPFFLLRTPDRIGHYFTKENNRVVVSMHEPISRFLAKATLEEADRSVGAGREGVTACLRYDFSGLPAATFTPFRYIPRSELEALRLAIDAFYAPARPATAKVNQQEKELRRNFRLPDPDLEPDAYWLYGPPHDRKLLILWGCEKTQNTSLYPGPDSAIPIPPKAQADQATLLGKLSQRIVPWSEVQKEAFALLLRSKDPLRRFVAAAVRDTKGKLVGYSQGQGVLPLADLRPLRYLFPGEVAAFRRAATQFYAPAHPDDTKTPDYEKELRRNFRLPDPDKTPALFYRTGSARNPKLLVLLTGDEQEDNTLPLVFDPALHAPPPPLSEPAPDSPASSPFVTVAAAPTPGAPGPSVRNLADALARWRVSYGKLAGFGVAAAALLALGLFAADQFTDKKPPMLKQAIALNDPKTINAIFDKPIAADSLPGATGKSSHGSFTIKHAERTIKVTAAALAPANASQVVLSLDEPLREQDGNYKLLSSGLRDTALRHNVEDDDAVPFQFEDKVPPAIQNISASTEGAEQLDITFTKPVETASATSLGNYKISGFTFQSGHLSDDKLTVTLTASSSFVNGQQYELTASDVRDISRASNTLAAVTRKFTYADTTPAKLTDIHADEAQLQLAVFFSKKIALESGKTPADYFSISYTDEKSAPAAIAINKMTVQSGAKSILLNTAPQHNGVKYTLVVKDLPDQVALPNRISAQKPEQRTFFYTGQEITTPPRLDKIDQSRDNTKLTLRFTEVITSANAENPTSYTLTDNDAHAKVAATTAILDKANSHNITLTLAVPLKDTHHYTVAAANLTDEVGNARPASGVLPGENNTFQAHGVSFELPHDLLRLEPQGVLLSADRRTITLLFNSDLEPGPAADKASYTILVQATGATFPITEARLAKGYKNRVEIQLVDPLAAGTVYGLKWESLLMAGDSTQTPQEYGPLRIP